MGSRGEQHIYSFNFEPNPNWNKIYAGGAEIQEYIQRVTDKYNLRKNVKFHSRVTEAIWDDAAGK
jgi:cation diffusion facilitator CzcD-associated flavoprotein CzcO